TAATESRSAVVSVSRQALSTYTATCAPTVFAVAVTVGCVEQFRFPHTLKVPGVPGLIICGTGGAAAGRRIGVRATSSRSARRNVRSNCWATLDRAARGAAASGGAASGLAPSLNACESSGTLLADSRTTRYSMVAEPDGFA